MMRNGVSERPGAFRCCWWVPCCCCCSSCFSLLFGYLYFLLSGLRPQQICWYSISRGYYHYVHASPFYICSTTHDIIVFSVIFASYSWPTFVFHTEYDQSASNWKSFICNNFITFGSSIQQTKQQLLYLGSQCLHLIPPHFQLRALQPLLGQRRRQLLHPPMAQLAHR